MYRYLVFGSRLALPIVNDLRKEEARRYLLQEEQ